MWRRRSKKEEKEKSGREEEAMRRLDARNDKERSIEILKGEVTALERIGENI